MKGTYLLFIKIIESVDIRIRGEVYLLDEGYYIYIGSAFGAGGLSSRLHRHLRKIKKKHWHIDQITTSKFSEIIGIGVLHKQRVECKLSKIIGDIEKTVPITGFGNSDCKKNCIGCGVCTVVCPKEAIKLVLRTPSKRKKSPKNIRNWMIKRSISRRNNLFKIL